MGTALGTEAFTDLDFANDVALLTEMPSLLILALETMNHEANSVGLQVNWFKTKIQTTVSSFPAGCNVSVADDNVSVAESLLILVLTSITP